MELEFNKCKECSWHNNHFLNNQEDANYCNRLHGIIDGEEFACALFVEYPIPIVNPKEECK